MSNGSTVTEFLLRGFSDVRELQVLHFVVFLVMYLAALVGNLLIIIAIVLNHHLHTPMYFFLGNLSVLDLGSISVSVPKSMFNSLLDTRSISYTACVAQVFLYVVFTTTDFALLTVMAYDRHVAICRPLHYERVMNRRACIHMAVSSWLAAIVYSALHTGNTFQLSFCQSNVLNQFFCEIPQLLKLACSSSYCSEIGVIGFGVLLFFTCFLTVVSLFLFTVSFAYLKPSSSSPSGLDLAMGVLYAVVPPMLNPVVYSLRNKELKAALKKLFVWRLFSK
uniref:Olfactory receptor n=1 Tax=Pelodiscus sinensis TaxID=13735 RepID=K7FPT5_PELSI